MAPRSNPDAEAPATQAAAAPADLRSAPQVEALISYLEHEAQPMIVLDTDYRILAANTAYQRQFGTADKPFLGRECYRVSHHYDVPCDLAGEHCPMKQAFESRGPDRVLHIHHTPRGPEHVDVELRPILDGRREVVAYVERLVTVRHASARASAQGLVGCSPSFNAALTAVQRVASSMLPVLLLGESGTGKELFARAVHEASGRARGPFVVVGLLGAGRDAVRERIVRLRARRLHRCQRAQARPGGDRARRHAVPRRNGRRPARHAGQAAAPDRDRHVPARGQHRDEAGRLPPRRRHPQAAGGHGGRWPLPPGPVLPHQRLPDPPAAAARARAGHPAAGRDVPPARRLGQAPRLGGAHRHGAPAGLFLARQHPRAPQRARACAPVRRRRHRAHRAPARKPAPRTVAARGRGGACRLEGAARRIAGRVAAAARRDEHCTRRELAERLGLSERTLYRRLKALHLA